MNENKQVTWTLYLHNNPFNNKKYIGITCQDPKNRWNNGLGYKNNQTFFKDIEKYGWNNFEHIIFKENIPEEKIGKLEEYYINLYNSTNPKYGYNKAKGGLNPGRLGIPHSEETKKKIGEANSKSVLCLNTNTLYPSIVEAARQLNISFKKISDCCNNTRGSKSAKGFYFIFSNKKLTQEECQNKINKLEKAAYTTQKKKVLCIETNTLYSSQIEAAKKLGFSPAALSNYFKGKQLTAGGYHWKRI